MAYSVLNVTIRRLVTGSMQMPVVLATVGSMGVISLGLTSVARVGWSGLENTALGDIGVMFIAGTFNAIGFFTLTKALQLVSIVQVNAVSASQSAIAAVAGVAIFGEKITASLALGVTFTILGLAVVDRGRKLHVKTAENDVPVGPVADEQVVAATPLQFPDATTLPREPTTR